MKMPKELSLFVPVKIGQIVPWSEIATSCLKTRALSCSFWQRPLPAWQLLGYHSSIHVDDKYVTLGILAHMDLTSLSGYAVGPTGCTTVKSSCCFSPLLGLFSLLEVHLDFSLGHHPFHVLHGAGSSAHHQFSHQGKLQTGESPCLLFFSLLE